MDYKGMCEEVVVLSSTLLLPRCFPASFLNQAGLEGLVGTVAAEEKVVDGICHLTQLSCRPLKRRAAPVQPPCACSGASQTCCEAHFHQLVSQPCQHKDVSWPAGASSNTGECSTRQLRGWEG